MRFWKSLPKRHGMKEPHPRGYAGGMVKFVLNSVCRRVWGGRNVENRHFVHFAKFSRFGENLFY